MAGDFGKGGWADWRQRSGNRVERGSRQPRVGSHPVVLDDCMSLQDALGKAERRLPIEAGAQQSCPVVQGEEAAGRGQALSGWMGGRYKTAAKLLRGSQPPRGRASLAAC